MIAARCSCGFAELGDEKVSDHLQEVFELDGPRGSDGQVHEECQHLACACGLSASTPGELDAHFIAVFTPSDAIGCDGQRHEPVEGPRR